MQKAYKKMADLNEVKSRIRAAMESQGVCTDDLDFSITACGRAYISTSLSISDITKLKKRISLRSLGKLTRLDKKHIKPDRYFKWNDSYFVARKFIKDVPQKYLMKFGELEVEGIALHFR